MINKYKLPDLKLAPHLFQCGGNYADLRFSSVTNLRDGNVNSTT